MQIKSKGYILKILLLSPLPPPAGGIAIWTLRYLEYCKERCISCMLVNTALWGKRKTQIQSKRSLVDEIKRTWFILRDFHLKIISENPDIVHLNTSCSRFGVFRDRICVLLAKRYSKPVVLQCHCNIQDQISGKVAEAAFRSMVRMSRKVLVLNRFSLAYVQKIANERVEVIPNFIDHGKVFARKNVSSKIHSVIFVGHVCKQKGAVEIIQAAKCFPDIRFLMIGPVQQDVEEMDSSNNVEFLGTQSQEKVMQLLKNADVFLFPSHTEGFANALLEAMATGLPVIATDVGANKEMIEDKGGIIVPANNSSEIINALKMMDSEEVRFRMGQWNIEKVKSYYLRDVVMGKLCNIYEEAIH